MRFSTLSLALLLASTLFGATAIGQGGASRFVYDRNGRLRAVVAPNGEANIYDYDPAGNFLAIRRVPSTHLELLDFFPKTGVPGDQITFLGVGFGSGVSSVAFTGAVASEFSFDSTTVIATVPVGTVDGIVTISTVNGQVSTVEPFLVQGVAIEPRFSVIGAGEQLQLSATVVGSGDQTVEWRVNGVVGGGPGVGVVSATGLYTAPANSVGAEITARSVAVPSLIGTARIVVFDQDQRMFGLSRGVTIAKEPPLVPDNINSFGITRGISVSKEPPPVPDNTNSFGTTRGISVSKEPPPVPDNTNSFGTTRGISVNKEPPLVPDNTNSFGITRGISVNKEPPPVPDNTNSFGIIRGISVTRGPVISSVSPATVTRGSSVPIIITGNNFNGFVTMALANNAGVNLNITFTNVVVNPAGTQISATLNVASGAAVGQRVLIVTTTAGNSMPGSGGSTFITIN